MIMRQPTNYCRSPEQMITFSAEIVFKLIGQADFTNYAVVTFDLIIWLDTNQYLLF